jgi:two-component system response regulator FixJ
MQASTIFTALVDDEAPVRKAVGLLLESAGFEVQTFRSGMEFIESLGGWRPDCVILDIHMPEMTGFEVQARLHALGLRLPVIFITAFEDLDLAQHLKQAEAAGFLLKPFTDEELMHSITLAVGEAANPPSIHLSQGERQ